MYYIGIDNHGQRYIIHADRLNAYQRGRIEQLSRRERRFTLLEDHLLKRCVGVYQNRNLIAGGRVYRLGGVS